MTRLLTSLILGVNSGISYALLGSTFTTYLKDNNISLVIIGLLSLRLMPYSFKYLWSPFVDSMNIKLFPANFGQRKSWLIATQILLIISISSLGLLDINKYFYSVCTIAFATSFLAATYDIAMEAFRIEIFQHDINKGTLFNVLGFRIGLIASGAGGLFLSSIIEWRLVFFILAALILPCIFIVSRSQDTRNISKEFKLNNFIPWFKQDFLQPFAVLFKLPHFYLIILIIGFYKLSDGYLDTMLIPFLLDIGYSKGEIATVAKTMGTCATVIGTVTGSYLISKYNISKNLLIAEIFAASSNLLFISLAKATHNLNLFMAVMCIENFISGICNIVLINYMSGLCDRKFTATHYAILISFSGFTRTLLSSTSGWVATNFSWSEFFLISSSLSLPSVICIYLLSRMQTTKPLQI
jgi:PAT family beta-lactamase induction signal transducer AmpG